MPPCVPAGYAQSFVANPAGAVHNSNGDASECAPAPAVSAVLPAAPSAAILISVELHAWKLHLVAKVPLFILRLFGALFSCCLGRIGMRGVLGDVIAVAATRHCHQSGTLILSCVCSKFYCGCANPTQRLKLSLQHFGITDTLHVKSEHRSILRQASFTPEPRLFML